MGAKTAISLIPPMVLEAVQLSSMRGVFALSLSIMENLKSMTYENVLAELRVTPIAFPHQSLASATWLAKVQSMRMSLNPSSAWARRD